MDLPQADPFPFSKNYVIISKPENPMSKAKDTTKKDYKKPFRVLTWIIAIVIGVAGIFLLIINTYYSSHFLPRTKVAGISVANLTREAAEEKLNSELQNYNGGIEFVGENYGQTITPEELGISIDLNTTIDEAWNEEKSGNWLAKTLHQTKLATTGYTKDIIYDIDSFVMEDVFSTEFYPLTTPFSNTTLEISDDGFIAIEGNEGEGLNARLLIARIVERTKNLNPAPITLPFIASYSQITPEELQYAKADAWQISQDPVELEYEDDSWTITPTTLESWVVFSTEDVPQEPLDHTGYAKEDNFDLDNLILATIVGANNIDKNFEKILRARLDKDAVEDYLATKVSPSVNIKPQNARFHMVDGALELISNSVPGQEILGNETYEAIVVAVRSYGPQAVAVASREIGANVNADNIDELGIKELIGSGVSNFAGSPSNRIHNIGVGADKLTGTLIAPDEEFSLVEALGEINAAAGYLPELVIKEKKTIPEYGGGLCQIATTMFRGAVETGLDITERQSHSYAVQYYAPQGTDATIYIPHPDLRYVNDTGNYILIQTSISGSILTFDFFGTNDGRTIELFGPETWDHKSDGSLKARWTQKVTMPNGTVREDIFSSNYRPPEEFHEDDKKEEEEKKKREEEERKKKEEEEAKRKEEEESKEVPDENVNSDENENVTPPPSNDNSDDNSNENTPVPDDNSNENTPVNNNTNSS